MEYRGINLGGRSIHDVCVASSRRKRVEGNHNLIIRLCGWRRNPYHFALDGHTTMGFDLSDIICWDPQNPWTPLPTIIGLPPPACSRRGERQYQSIHHPPPTHRRMSVCHCAWQPSATPFAPKSSDQYQYLQDHQSFKSESNQRSSLFHESFQS
jgi:hypothetical protein